MLVHQLFTLEAVRSIMVHFSSTALAAAIRAFFFSSFKSCSTKTYTPDVNGWFYFSCKFEELSRCPRDTIIKCSKSLSCWYEETCKCDSDSSPSHTHETSDINCHLMTAMTCCFQTEIQLGLVGRYGIWIRQLNLLLSQHFTMDKKEDVMPLWVPLCSPGFNR